MPTVTDFWSTPVLLTSSNLKSTFYSNNDILPYMDQTADANSVVDIMGGDLIYMQAATSIYIPLIDGAADVRYKQVCAENSNVDTNIESIWFRYFVSDNVAVFMFGNTQTFTKYRIVAISHSDSDSNKYVGFECMVNTSSTANSNKFINNGSVLSMPISSLTQRSLFNNGFSDRFALTPVYVGNTKASNIFTIDGGTTSLATMTPFIINDELYVSPIQYIALKIDTEEE